MKQSNHYSGTSIELICGAEDKYSPCVCLSVCIVLFFVLNSSAQYFNPSAFSLFLFHFASCALYFFVVWLTMLVFIVQMLYDICTTYLSIYKVILIEWLVLRKYTLVLASGLEIMNDSENWIDATNLQKSNYFICSLNVTLIVHRMQFAIANS